MVPDGTIGSGVVINLNGVGGNATGLEVNTGSVTVDSLTVQGQGSGVGVTASVNGHLTLTGTTTLTVNSPGGAGMIASGTGALIDGLSRPTIVANNGNFNTNGALARNGGHIELPNGMDITVNGNGANAVNAENDSAPGSFIDATHGTTLTVNASNGIGARMLNGGLVQLDNSTVLTLNGDTSTGIKLDGTQVPNGTIGPGLVINLNGPNTLGLWATISDAVFVNPAVQPSTVTVDNLTVTGSGLIADSGSTITATNSNITINGQSGSALDVEGGDPFTAGGTINFINSTATAVGAARSAARAITGTATDPNVLNISNSTLIGEQSAGITALSAFLNVNISNNSQVVGGNGIMVSAVDLSGPLGLPTPTPSVVNLVATTNSVLTGDAMADDTSTLNMTLQSGALWTGAAQNVTNVNVGATATWDMTADSTVSQTTTNAGLIQYAAPTGDPTLLTSYKTLTTTNYVGQGGTIGLNTFLGDDTSPSDRLVINAGTASGNSFLHFSNTGGPGALTTANGILVVDAINGATTTAGAFTMANPELRAGAFDYRLFQGGLNGSDPNNWYLRSTMIMPPIPPIPPVPPTPPMPIIGPELATYGVVQPMAQQLGRAMLGTHDDRFGDLYQMPCEPTAPIYTKGPVYTKAPTTDRGTDGWRPAVWGRLFGQQIDNHYQATLADPRDDGQITGFQTGVDVLRSDSLIAGHKDYAALYFSYGNANVDVSGLVTNAAATANVLQHTGALNLNAYSGGAYWTHYGPQGWYVDLVLQGTSYSDAAATQFAHLDTSGTGFISSIETGYPIAVPQVGFGFVLEPQAQVLGQWINFDAGNDGLGPVALGTTSETTARVGVKGKWTIPTDGGQVWQPYVRANFWSDFGGTAATLFGSDSIPLFSHAQYMDVDAGFTTKIDTHFSAFADAGYQFAVSNDGGGQRNGVKGTAGLRYQW